MEGGGRGKLIHAGKRGGSEPVSYSGGDRAVFGRAGWCDAGDRAGEEERDRQHCDQGQGTEHFADGGGTAGGAGGRQARGNRKARPSYGQRVSRNHRAGETGGLGLYFRGYLFLNCGKTFWPKRRACSRRSSPHSSSMMCVQPEARYSSSRSMHCDGEPAIGQTFCRTGSVTVRAAAFLPPCSMASAMGRISSKVRPAHSSSVSAKPPLLSPFFARSLPPISLIPPLPHFVTLP